MNVTRWRTLKRHEPTVQELARAPCSFLRALPRPDRLAIDARDDLGRRGMIAEGLAQHGVRYFADGGAGPRRFDRGFERVAAAAACRRARQTSA